MSKKKKRRGGRSHDTMEESLTFDGRERGGGGNFKIHARENMNV